MAPTSADAPTPLPAFPEEGLRRVLCVVAHPDDLEYGTSCAVARWTSQGVEVSYLLLTRGEAGIDSSHPAETAELRVREQVVAAAAVGVNRVDFLEYPDGVLEYGLDLRRDVARAIRDTRPDAVLTITGEHEARFGLNQADHRVAALVVADAARDAGNRWVFTDLVDEGLAPWSPRWLLVAAHSAPTHAVDVTGDPLEHGIASLEAHAQYLAGVPGHPVPREMIPAVTVTVTAADGQRAGVQHAVALQVWDLGGPREDPGT